MSESQYGIMGMLNLFGTVSGKDIFEQSWMLGRPDAVEQDHAGFRLGRARRRWLAPDRRWSQRVPLRPQHVEGKRGGRARRVRCRAGGGVKSFLLALIARTRHDVPGSRSKF